MGMGRTSGSTLEKVNILTVSQALPVGTTLTGVGRTDEEHELVNYLVDELGGGFSWTIFGVAPKEGVEEYTIDEIPSTVMRGDLNEYTDLFLDCRMPFDHMKIVNNLLLQPLTVQFYDKYI